MLYTTMISLLFCGLGSSDEVVNIDSVFRWVFAVDVQECLGRADLYILSNRVGDSKVETAGTLSSYKNTMMSCGLWIGGRTISNKDGLYFGCKYTLNECEKLQHAHSYHSLLLAEVTYWLQVFP